MLAFFNEIDASRFTNNNLNILLEEKKKINWIFLEERIKVLLASQLARNIMKSIDLFLLFTQVLFNFYIN